MTDTKTNLNLELYLCTDVCRIIEIYYYGLRVEYGSNGTKHIEWISSRTLTYDTKRRRELISITGDGIYYLDEIELFKNCIRLTELPKNVIVTMKNMKYMFHKCRRLRCNINNWDVSRVENMSGVFCKSNFNRDIGNWDVSRVTNMSYLFDDSNFNRDISNWDVSSVENMSGTFSRSIFNRDISRWDVSKVKNMCSMFWHSEFNRDIGEWDVRHVTIMNELFAGSKFNRDISRWDVSGANDMSYMFAYSSFDRNIDAWDVSRVTHKVDMFDCCPGAVPNWYRG